MSGLTRKQRALLEFIDRRIAADGVTPSFDEMRQGMGLASKSGIHRMITALEERGFIRRLPNRARALEVLRSADGVQDDPVVRLSEQLTSETRRAAQYLELAAYWEAEAKSLALALDASNAKLKRAYREMA